MLQTAKANSAGMVASPDSQRPYYPMVLANGSDAVLISYSGSMASGLTGHSHLEQHQGSLCGWYKPAHAGHLVPRYLPLLVESGYQVLLDGEVCDISGFEQRFSPRSAILRTRAAARGVVLEIDAFLTDDHTLVERYRVVTVPKGKKASLAFYVRAYQGFMGGLVGAHKPEVKVRRQSTREVNFDYGVGGIRGAGFMVADRPADENYSEHPGVQFNNLRRGFAATKVLSLLDSTDARNYRARLAGVRERCERDGPTGLGKRHESRWRSYTNRSAVRVPDPEIQHLYDYSIYYLRANQHPETGCFSCGPLPHLWAGGVHCPYDAAFAHQALLRTNRLDEAAAYPAFYRGLRTAARGMARSIGLPGAIYSGWSDLHGNHLGVGKGRDWREYLLKYKPLMPAYAVLAAYWQWALDPDRDDHRQNLPYMRDILDLAIDRFIIEQNEYATMRPCAPGNESEIEVENDTLNGLAYARALSGYAAMAGAIGAADVEAYARLGGKLSLGVARNEREGVLLPYPDAPYLTGLQLDFYMLTLPKGGNEASVMAGLNVMRTPWGLDSDQPSEAYRDWPWMNARAAIVLAHLKKPKPSFDWLTKTARYASSLGALPEKIRMDGFAIGYGYVSPHALFAWALSHAFCHDGVANEVALLWGMDGSWRDMRIDHARLAGGLLVSLEVRRGRVVSADLTNRSARTIERSIRVNPSYPGLPDSNVTVRARQTLSLAVKQ